jgi:hypothetical protein
MTPTCPVGTVDTYPMLDTPTGIYIDASKTGSNIFIPISNGTVEFYNVLSTLVFTQSVQSNVSSAVLGGTGQLYMIDGSNLSFIDGPSNTYETIPLPESPSSIVYCSTDALAYINLQGVLYGYDSTLSLSNTINPSITSDYGSLIFGGSSFFGGNSYSSGVSMINYNTGNVTQISTNGSLVYGLEFKSPYLFVANGPSGTVQIFDTSSASNPLVQTISLGGSITKLTLDDITGNLLAFDVLNNVLNTINASDPGNISLSQINLSLLIIDKIFC